MEVSVFRVRVLATACFALSLVLLVPEEGVAQPFELSVRHDRAFGSSEGTLVFTAQGVDYQAADGDDARQWRYEDLKQVRVLSPTRLALATYEAQGWLRFRADRTFNFEVTGGPVSDELGAFLLEHVPLPPVVAVIPTRDSPLLFGAAVKLRQGGSHGRLELVGEYLIYRTERQDHNRVWGLGDLHLVFQPDRHRLTVQAYEGGGDRRRAFEFDLKHPLPAGALEAIWAGMYGPSWPRIGRRE